MRISAICGAITAIFIGMAGAGRTETKAPDTPIAGPAWRLQSINGQAFTARATLQFARDGAVSGHGPCNSYAGTARISPPDIAIGPLRLTRRACPDLAAEGAFFDALSRMASFHEMPGALILRDRRGDTMVFVIAR
jgi:heat shock protein HslJ